MTKIPSVPRVDCGAFLFFCCAKVKLVSITTLKEERAWKLSSTFGRTLDEDLSFSCFDGSEIYQLRVIILQGELAVGSRDHMLRYKGAPNKITILSERGV